MKNILKQLTFIVFLTGILLIPSFVLADAEHPNISDAFGNESAMDASATKAGYNVKTNNVNTIISIAINFIFGILGTIFMINVIMGGFDWIMAGGNEKKVESSRDKIKHSIIGLLAIAMAYSIAYALTSMIGLTLKT